MKICVTCVYWTLLFISVASSALLFIIVASENAQTNYHESSERNETTETYDNDTLDDTEVDIEKSDIPISELHGQHKLNIKYEEHYYQETFTEGLGNFETITRSKENPYKNPDTVAEILTQQPNLSQGITESEQATVLTLGDTTAVELQNLAEPKLNSEFSRTKLFPQNSSLLTKNVDISQKQKQEEKQVIPNTKSPSLSIINDIDEKPNETNSLEKEPLILSNPIDDEAPEIVVVVRAEQTPVITESTDQDSGSAYKFEDDVVKVLPDEIPKTDDTFATEPELSDTEAKARLVGDNRDDSAAVILGEGIVTVGSSNTHEDIPSFSEWTQKRLEEAEKKKTHPNASVQNSGTPVRGIGGMKVRSKNYASPDCGAKIVAVNPEARSARSVLVSTRDEYMLNTCTSRIWFVVELCEAIQAKKIELANFELFSSSPKDFLVYISDRFPTRDWSPVGHFTAKDVKDIQSFALQPHLFGKFIKVELQTYYGSEHFCPISLFRAYGTSEFEVLETETENQLPRETHTSVHEEEDSDEEEDLDAENGEPPRNLFGSARDAVLSIMKKAAEVLVKSSELTGNNITNIQQSIDSANILENSFFGCTTPRYTIFCENCSDERFAKIFQLVSCREQQLNEFLKIDVVNKTLRRSELCYSYGVQIEAFDRKDVDDESESINAEKQGKHEFKDRTALTFITSILKPEYIAALCNVLAIKERKMVMNTSHEILFNSKDTIKEDTLYPNKEEYSSDAVNTHTPSLNDDASLEFKKNNQQLPSEECNKITSIPTEISSSSENVTPQTKLTKTLSKEEVKNDSSIPILESSKGDAEITVPTEILTTTATPSSLRQHSVLKTSEDPPITPGTSIENSPHTTSSVPMYTIHTNEFASDDVVPDVESVELAGTLTKTEKIEQLDQEGKQGQAENLDQEIKLPSQDTLTFDNILLDLKDLEGETAHVPSGSVASSSTTQSTTNTTPQKESVFLRLSNRIKALERNMSLSGQYLEELSRRYKKQVEEMQRSLERTVSAMSEETKKRDERELKRAEEIAILKDEIANLSQSVQNLLYDRDSWRAKIWMIGQHVLLICSEVFVIYLILLYCRGSSNRKSNARESQPAEKDALRRKSAENFSSHMKKTKKRRPSEIASHITGTYRELMINDKSHETKKEKKKKRKKTTAFVSNQAIGSNDAERISVAQYRTVTNVGHQLEVAQKVASSAEVLQIDSEKQICRRLKSAPENTVDWFNDNGRKAEYNVQLMSPYDDHLEIEPIQSCEFNNSSVENLNGSYSFPTNIVPEIVTYTEEQTAIGSSDVFNSKNTNMMQETRLRVTSSFMKTALSSRKKRRKCSNDMNGEFSQNSGDSDDKTVQISLTSSKPPLEKTYIDSDTTTNGLLVDQSDESRSSSAVSMSKKKEKRSTGFKKMSCRWSRSSHDYMSG